jgi:hypothetical protein
MRESCGLLVLGKLHFHKQLLSGLSTLTDREFSVTEFLRGLNDGDRFAVFEIGARGRKKKE